MKNEASKVANTYGYALSFYEILILLERQQLIPLEYQQLILLEHQRPLLLEH